MASYNVCDVENVNSEVRNVVKKVHEEKSKVRDKKRSEAQNKVRGLSKSELTGELKSAELQQILSECKTKKISADNLKRLSEGFKETSSCEKFLNEDGCLHGLVGLVSGNQWNKQILSLYCLVNLAAAKIKSHQIARACGPYLVTHISGSNTQLVELSLTVLVNLTQSKDQDTHWILHNQETLPSIINVTKSQSESIQELSYNVIYNMLTHSDVEGESLIPLTELVTSRLCKKCPIHLLWLLYCLSSNQMLHSNLFSVKLVDTLMQIATYEIFQKCDSRPLIKVLTPVIRSLSNLCGGPVGSEVSLHLVRHPDFSPILTSLLSTNYSSICQESVWWLGNIVNNENMQVQEEFVELELMEKLENPAYQAIARLDPYALAHR